MAKKVIVEFTEKEASELLNVAGNGYGDGDYYIGGGYGNGHDKNAYHRAVHKLIMAL